MFNTIVTSAHELDEAVGTLDPRTDALKRFLEWNDINSFTRVWFLTDGQHGKEATLRTLLSGRRVKTFPHIQGVYLARVEPAGLQE